VGRPIALAVVLAAGLAFLVWVVAPGIDQTGRHAGTATSGSLSSKRRPTVTTQAPVPSTTTTTIDPGTLPQTHDLPSASSPQFEARMLELWNAIVADEAPSALPAFFPLSAYIQVKAISDPIGDWHDRLVANYDADIHRLHLELGPSAGGARLVSVDVPTSAAEWVLPGVEYNKGSYYRVYATQMHYEVDGRGGSFTISSLISWRGEWYVVHLGPIR
jgi:hypothetical protein